MRRFFYGPPNWLVSDLQVAIGKIEALEAALEEALQERDEYRELGGDYKAALKAVPALVEALRRIADPTHSPKSEEAVLVQIEVEQIAREALAKWEQAQ